MTCFRGIWPTMFLQRLEDSLTGVDTYAKLEQLNKFLQCRAFAAEER